MGRWLFLCAVVLASGCSPFRSSARTPSAIELAEYVTPAEKRVVYVMSNGFHTGLIVRSQDVPREAWPEVDAIPEHPWVEVGWGSEIFYRAEKITVPVVLGAVFPNSSVLHVVGWDEPPQQTFGGDLVRLELEPDRYEELCRYVHASYVLDDDGDPEHLGPGIYGDGAFFRAKGKYYFPKTCNVWTARALRTGGLPIVPELCGVADAVLVAARRAGTHIRRR